MSRVAVLTLVLMGLCRAQAAEPRGLLVLDEWGTYAATFDHQVAEPNATSGHISLSRDLSLIGRTHQICAELGAHFGIRYHMRNDVAAPFLMVDVAIDHPPMMNTKGALQTRDAFVRKAVAGATGYSGWTFSDPRELRAGEWHIIVSYAGTIQIDERFDVYTGCAAPVS